MRAHAGRDRRELRTGARIVANDLQRTGAAPEPVLLHGLLAGVDPEGRTARLDGMYGEPGRSVRFSFVPALDGEMRRLAGRRVAVRGHGAVDDASDSWTGVHAEAVEGDRSIREPFDREAFLNDPNPKVFDPSEVVKAIKPFDVDEFIRTIYEARRA